LSIVGAPDRAVAAQLGLGARLAGYRFDAYRPNLKPEKKPTLSTVAIVTDSAAGARAGDTDIKAELDFAAQTRILHYAMLAASDDNRFDTGCTQCPESHCLSGGFSNTAFGALGDKCSWFHTCSFIGDWRDEQKTCPFS
jgi:hypothetical protein